MPLRVEGAPEDKAQCVRGLRVCIFDAQPEDGGHESMRLPEAGEVKRLKFQALALLFAFSGWQVAVAPRRHHHSEFVQG